MSFGSCVSPVWERSNWHNCCSTLTCHVILPLARVAAPDPELPRITWTAASPPPEPVQQGLVGCIELGQTEAAKMFGGVLYRGIVTRFQHPYYQVTYADGDVEEYTGRDVGRHPRALFYIAYGVTASRCP